MNAVSQNPAEAIAAVGVGRFLWVTDLPGPAAAARSALRHAVRCGDLISVHRGLYYKGAQTRYGMARPSTAEVAVKVFGTNGVGPTSRTAARTLELTAQVPVELQLVVTGRVSRRIRGVRIMSRSNQGRRQLRYVEIAVLELLRGGWQSTVDDGWAALVESISREIRRGALRLDVLSSVARAERCAALHADMALSRDQPRLAGSWRPGPPGRRCRDTGVVSVHRLPSRDPRVRSSGVGLRQPGLSTPTAVGRARSRAPQFRWSTGWGCQI